MNSIRPLRRNLDFQLLWVGSTLTFLGMESADIAYPLAVLALTGSPGRAALVGAVQTLATLLAGLPAGAVADRHDRRRILVTTEVVRTAAAAMMVLAVVTHRLTLSVVLAVAAVVGAATPFAATARILLVRTVVPTAQLTSALTQEQVRDGISQLAGPPLGGFLYGVRQQLPFLFGAATFAANLGCALLVRAPRDETTRDGAPRGALVGLTIIWGDRALRAAALLVAALNTIGAPIVLIATVILRRQAVSPAVIGLTLACFAVGSLLGAALVKPLHSRLRPGVLLLGVVAVEAPLVAALGLPWGPWWIGSLLLAAGVGIPALQVLVDVLILRQVPDERRGRVVAAVITLFGIGMPVGSALAGVLLQYLGPSGAMLVLGSVLLVAVGHAASRPHLRRAEWPVS